MRFYQEINFLPKVPNYFNLSLEEIEEFENVFPDKDYNHTFASYVAPQELSDFIQKHFTYSVITRYQVIKKNVPVHVDSGIGIEGIKYNYILQSGGSGVTTRWWDKGSITESVCIKERVWHSLQVNVPHDVTKVNGARISLTVKRTV